MKEKRKYRGQITFTAVGRLGNECWNGRIVNTQDAMDEADKRHPVPVTWTPYFNIFTDPEGGYKVELNGGPTYHSLRYSWYPTLTKAQAAGVRWAARRFYYKTEV